MKKHLKALVGLLAAVMILVGGAVFFMKNADFLIEAQVDSSAEISDLILQAKRADRTVLEIVPNLQYAEFGYLVSGQEPVNVEMASANGVASTIINLGGAKKKEPWKISEKEYNDYKKADKRYITGEDDQELWEKKGDNYVCKNSLAESLDLFKKECIEDSSVETVAVLTVTAKQLRSASNAQTLIDLADMFYISTGTYMSKQADALEAAKKYSNIGVKDNEAAVAANFEGDNDLDWKCVEAIFERVANKENPIPLIMDSNCYDSAIAAGKSAGTQYQYQIEYQIEDKTENGVSHKAVTPNIRSFTSGTAATGKKGSDNNVCKLYIMSMFRDPVEFSHTFMSKIDNSGNYDVQTDNSAKKYWNAYTFLPAKTDNEDNITAANESYWKDERNIMLDTASVKNETNCMSWNSDTSFIKSISSNANTIKKMIKYQPKNTVEKGKTAADPYRILLLEPYMPNDVKQQMDKVIKIMHKSIPYAEMSGDYKYQVKVMTTAEFVGNIDDICSDYDMVYIGSSHDKMVDNGYYNDRYYAHLGDQVHLNAGIFSKGYILDGMMGGSENYRFPGNDISKLRKDRLEEFLKSHPIFVSDTLLKEDGSIEKIQSENGDNNMYALIHDNRQKDGMISAGHFNYHNLSVEDSNKVVAYLDRSNPVVELLSKPVEYDASNPSSFDINKSAKFSYRFKVNDNDYQDDTSIRYTAKLYVDVDADGDFSEDREYIGKKTNIKPNGRNSFTLSVPLNVRLHGGVCWKLDIYRNGDTTIKKVIKGTTYVSSGERKTIRVLQVQSNTEHFVYGDGAGRKQNTNTWNLQNDSVFNELIKKTQVSQDFNIIPKTISLHDFCYEDSKRGCKLEDLQANYDMLIFGFGDSYQDVTLTTKAAAALDNFIEAGKSVLLTHDLTFVINNNALAGQYNKGFETTTGTRFTNMFRDRLGMNRFGLTFHAPKETQYSDRGYTLPAADFSMTYDGKNFMNYNVANARNYRIGHTGDNEYRINHDKTSQAEKQGFTYTALMQYSNPPANAQGMDIAGPFKNLKCNTAPGDPSGSYYLLNVHTGYETTRVNNANYGQITKYPFEIPDDFTISTTHGQYYQLNMEDPDIVVWYTLSDDKGGKGNDAWYSTSPKDVSNNYYIYSRGNVTYSGVGHRDVSSYTEKQLFVNTMIAAYRTSVIGPGGEVLDSVYSEASDEYYIYADVDAESNLSDYSGTIDVDFVTTDDILQSGDKLYIRLLVQDKDGNYQEKNTTSGEFKITGPSIGSYHNITDSMGNVVSAREVLWSHFDEERTSLRHKYTIDYPVEELRGKNRSNFIIEVYNKNNGLKGQIKGAVIRRTLFKLD